MANIAGVATKKNAKGEVTHIAFSMKKHGHTLLPIFKEMGLVEKTAFDKECEQGISLEESRRNNLEFVKNLPWKK